MNAIKRGVLESMLGQGKVMVRVRQAGVVGLPEDLPAGFPGIVTLSLSWRYKGMMIFDETGIRVDLSFSGQMSECIIPWEEILTIGSEATGDVVFPGSAPVGYEVAILQVPAPESAPEPPPEAEPLPSNVVQFKRRG